MCIAIEESEDSLNGSFVTKSPLFLVVLCVRGRHFYLRDGHPLDATKLLQYTDVSACDDIFARDVRYTAGARHTRECQRFAYLGAVVASLPVHSVGCTP